MSKKTHGNSKESKKEQHLYEIKEKEADETIKFGISGSKLNKNGSSPRANSQINRLNKKVGIKKFFAKIRIKGIKGRKEALEKEKEVIRQYLKKNKGKMPKAQKRPNGQN